MSTYFFAAPLLFRGAYSGMTAHRREARAETRRNSLETLASEQASVLEEQREDFMSSSESSISHLDNSTHSMTRWPISLESINEHARANETLEPVTSPTDRHHSTSPTNLLVCHPTCRRRPTFESLSFMTEDGPDGSLLKASVFPMSSHDALTAVLVSDEVIEADHIHTSFNNGTTIEGTESMLLPSAIERLQMMDDIVLEVEEERDMIVQEFEQRERRMKAVILVLLLSFIIAIIVIVVIR